MKKRSVIFLGIGATILLLNFGVCIPCSALTNRNDALNFDAANHMVEQASARGNYVSMDYVEYGVDYTQRLPTGPYRGTMVVVIIYCPMSNTITEIHYYEHGLSSMSQHEMRPHGPVWER